MAVIEADLVLIILERDNSRLEQIVVHFRKMIVDPANQVDIVAVNQSSGEPFIT